MFKIYIFLLIPLLNQILAINIFPNIYGEENIITYNGENELTNEIKNNNIDNQEKKNKWIINFDDTININSDKMSPLCTIECCTSCRIQFPELVQQKYCITIICKCEIIEKKNSDIKVIENKVVNNDNNISNNNDINKDSLEIRGKVPLLFLKKNSSHTVKEKNFLFYSIICIFVCYEVVVFHFCVGFKETLKFILSRKSSFEQYNINKYGKLPDFDIEDEELIEHFI